MSAQINEVTPNTATDESFWMPGNYQVTVKRFDDAYHTCNEVIACFQDRAKIERQYAQQLSEWTSKWRPLVDSSPLYGSLLRAWQCFFTAADKLAVLHGSICRSLVSEDGDRVRTWQREMFHRKLFGGFRESHDVEAGFARAQKPWAKKLKKLEKARSAFHKASRREHQASMRENHAKGNPDVSIEKQKKIQEEREHCSQESLKMRARYEKVLEDVSRYAPRYMEEMETVFEKSQEMEQKRISFLKQAFLSIHSHLDVTTNESVQAVYNELHQTIMAISEQDDLRWWKNKNGPGMTTHWPQFEEWTPERDRLKKSKEQDKVKLQADTVTEKSYSGPGVRVRALYDYSGQEVDELSFKAGEEFLKVEDEDEQGWCKGITNCGQLGLYPANYVEIVN
ncbi:protein kinase C and casein kinase substrate in neurons protein 3 isoform X1 [Erpetoichthys calabaricus]|nr:protein kinase C and casein kinase substrate in neurons protein 3 isoform X1 [Erpetoichthys calabaricus]